MVGRELGFSIALLLQVRAKTEHPTQEESQRQRKTKAITSPQRQRGEERKNNGGVEHSYVFLSLIPSN